MIHEMVPIQPEQVVRFRRRRHSPLVVELVTTADGEFYQLSQTIRVGRDITEPAGQVVEHCPIAAVSEEWVRFRIGPEVSVEGRRLCGDDELDDPFPDGPLGLWPSSEITSSTAVGPATR
jgi:hypothetical protein